MKLTNRRIGVVASVVGGATVALFAFDYVAGPFPQPIRDLRWILLLLGGPCVTSLLVVRKIRATNESFRLGVIVGEHRQIFGGGPEPRTPTDAGTTGPTKRIG